MLRVLQTSGRISYLADLKTSLFCCDPTYLRNSTGLRGARSIISGYPVVEIDKQKSGRSKSYPLVPRMSDKVIVKHRKEEGGKFTFSFHLKISDLKIDKQFNLCREVTEETNAFMERLSSNIVKANKKNKGHGEERLKPKFTLENGELEINGEVNKTIGDFLFMEGLCLTIDDQKFVVKVNPPLVTELKMSEVVVAGLLIYPHKLEVEFADSTQVEWFSSERVCEDPIEKGAKLNKKAKVEAEDSITWMKVGKGRLFTASEELVQCRQELLLSSGMSGYTYSFSGYDVK